MKRSGWSLLALLALLPLLCWPASSQAADERVGDVKNVSGKVLLLRGDQQLSPAVGDVLLVKDSVRTGADGSIGISFVDGTRLSLAPSSEAALQDYVFAPLEGDFAFGLQVLKGKAAYISGRLGKLAPTAVRISTPHATIGIRGTSFVVQVN